MNARSKAIFMAMLGFTVLALVWHSIAGMVAQPTILPQPFEVAKKAFALAVDRSFLAAAWSTAVRWAVGFGAGALAGFVLGLLVGSSAWSRRTFLPVVDFLRSIPVSIAFPVFLLAFGISDATNIAMAFAATVFLVTLNVAIASANTHGNRLSYLQTMRASWLHRMLYLHIPEAIHNFLIGLRATLSLSLIVVLISEMFIGTGEGLGQLAYNSYLESSPTTLYAIILWVGVAGTIANAALSIASESVLRRLTWRNS